MYSNNLSSLQFDVAIKIVHTYMKYETSFISSILQCGFFRRKEKEELEKLKRLSDFEPELITTDDDIEPK